MLADDEVISFYGLFSPTVTTSWRTYLSGHFCQSLRASSSTSSSVKPSQNPLRMGTSQQAGWGTESQALESGGLDYILAQSCAFCGSQTC